jgi:hypothetical protein
MESTYQFENIDMLEHGKMVHRSYEELLNAMKTNNINYLNQWTGFKDIEQMQFLLDNQYPFWIMQHYQIYHDCGKPFCRAIVKMENNIFLIMLKYLPKFMNSILIVKLPIP